jgi:hypothetical protein
MFREHYSNGCKLSNKTPQAVEQYASTLPLNLIYMDRNIIGFNMACFAFKFMLGKYVPDIVGTTCISISLISIVAYTAERALQNFFFALGLNQHNERWCTNICPSMRMTILDTLYPIIVIGLLNESGYLNDKIPFELSFVTPLTVLFGHLIGSSVGSVEKQLSAI